MELIRHSPLNPIWLKATVVGSLWASVEIVAGSFLHNLQVPLSGTILTAFAIFLLSAFSRIWKENGIIWRAGIICALMKSISPSAVIIGPMVGIISEALLFELVLIVLGRNLVGTSVAGAFTAVSAIVHKFFTLLILYGFDLIRILDSLYQYAVNQLNASGIKAIDMIGVLAAFYMLIGIFSAIAGFLVGRNFLTSNTSFDSTQGILMRNEKNTLRTAGQQRYAVVFISFHLFILFLILWLLNLNFYLPSITISTLYILACLLRYPASIHRLKKPAVLVQFFIIFAAAVLISDVLKMNNPAGESGWIIGLKMIARAILLIIGFAAISVELKNPLVKTVLYKRGLSNLYQSLTLAFGVLPDLISSLSNSKQSILNPVSLTSHLLNTSQNLVEIFNNEQKNLPTVFVLTGYVGGGKTTIARELSLSLHEKGVRLGGFLSVGIDEGSRRLGFQLVELGTSKSIVLCQTAHTEGWPSTGRYFFNPEAIESGKRILDPSSLLGKDLVVIDEIGPLELKDQGWATAIEELCSNFPIPQIWVVRKSLVSQVIKKWRIGDVYIFDLTDDGPEKIQATILDSLRVKL
ncbi:MAG: nucleoside-triphosphatase [Prolixibacteraceae bacterium]